MPCKPLQVQLMRARTHAHLHMLLGLKLQAARLLALLALQSCARPRLLSTAPAAPAATPSGLRTQRSTGGRRAGPGADVGKGGGWAPVFEGGVGWQWWLRAAAGSEDCWLSSHATKALLNLEAVLEGEAPAQGRSRGEAGAGAGAGTGTRKGRGKEMSGLAGTGGGAGVEETGLGLGGGGRGGNENGRLGLSGPCPSPVWGDMVHLLHPQAQHHWVQSGAAVVPRRWACMGARGRPCVCVCVYACVHACLCTQRRGGVRTCARVTARVHGVTARSRCTCVEVGRCISGPVCSIRVGCSLPGQCA